MFEHFPFCLGFTDSAILVLTLLFIQLKCLFVFAMSWLDYETISPGACFISSSKLKHFNKHKRDLITLLVCSALMVTVLTLTTFTMYYQCTSSPLPLSLKCLSSSSCFTYADLPYFKSYTLEV